MVLSWYSLLSVFTVNNLFSNEITPTKFPLNILLQNWKSIKLGLLILAVLNPESVAAYISPAKKEICETLTREPLSPIK